MTIIQKPTNTKTVFDSDINTNIYINYRHKEEDFFRSELYFLKDIIPKFKTILDIGSACGGFFNICRSWNPKIEYTGLEMNANSVDIANKQYGLDQNAPFILGQFPDQNTESFKYDLVNVFEIVFFAQNWMEWIDAITAQTSKYATFTNRVRLSGSTVMDPNLSYALYLRTDEIIPYFVFNLNEFLNYLKHPKHGLKSISVFGYPMPHNPYHCLPLPSNEVYCTAFLLQKGKPKGPFAEVHMNIEEVKNNETKIQV
jgi:hypothetical protein